MSSPQADSYERLCLAALKHVGIGAVGIHVRSFHISVVAPFLRSLAKHEAGLYPVKDWRSMGITLTNFVQRLHQKGYITVEGQYITAVNSTEYVASKARESAAPYATPAAPAAAAAGPKRYDGGSASQPLTIGDDSKSAAAAAPAAAAAAPAEELSVTCPYPECQSRVAVNALARHLMASHASESQRGLKCPVCAMFGEPQAADDMLLHVHDAHRDIYAHDQRLSREFSALADKMIAQLEQDHEQQQQGAHVVVEDDVDEDDGDSEPAPVFAFGGPAKPVAMPLFFNLEGGGAVRAVAVPAPGRGFIVMPEGPQSSEPPAAAPQPQHKGLVRNVSVHSGKPKQCEICFEDMREGQRISRLGCLCAFHDECISRWFEKRACCPNHPTFTS
eukprot:m51a1_g14239 putative e3 ubiquitin-protein ligase znrf2 (389) ;mRNA; r:231920-233404